MIIFKSIHNYHLKTLTLILLRIPRYMGSGTKMFYCIHKYIDMMMYLAVMARDLNARF